jgi:lysophospholipid acyltransferase (LPLAT)-like uncharacterized protein
MAETENPQPEATPLAPPRQGGVVVPHQASLRQQLAGVLAYALLRAVLATLRCRLTDPSGFFARPRHEPAIFCFWHNRLACCMKAYHLYGKNRTGLNKIAALVSASKDGGFLSRILELFEVQPVRGSSSRRGPQALRELTTWAVRGYDLAITPDGPRGPRYQIQDGVTSLAQLTGLMIVPATFNLRGKISARSWDRFQIPLPFARCDIVVGEPLAVPREATDEQREVLRQELERRMREMTRD